MYYFFSRSDFFLSSSSQLSGHSSVTIFMASRLVSLSCSEIYLCVSSKILFTQFSITTGYVPSGHSSLTSHISIIAGDVILGSVAFLFLYLTILYFSYSWYNPLSPFFFALCKFIYFNLSSIVFTLTIGFSWKYDDEKVGSLYGVESIPPSLSFLYFWTFVHSLHKVDFGLFYLLCVRKTGLNHCPTFLINSCSQMFLSEE